MNSLKKLPMALTVLGLGAASSFGEIKVGDNLSISGFLDMSASGKVDSAENADATLIGSFDQFEVDFMWKFGDKVSARADINAHPGTANPHLGSDTGMAVDLEQGFVSAHLGSLSLSAGRFLSSSGFEAAEPTGLYQYSISKTTPVYGKYQNGINAAWTSPMLGVYGAVVTDLWHTSESDYMTPGFEGQVSITPAAGVTAKATYLYQMLDEDLSGGDASQQLLNVWGQYAQGPITAALEYNLLLDWAGGTDNEETGHGWLAMANYKLTDTFAATLRYSGIVIGDGDPDQEVTISPSVALSPNWLVLAEFKQEIDSEISNYAVESLFSF